MPLEFLSWHYYHGDSSDPYDMVRIGWDVRRLLDANSLRKTESHVNEWNLNLTKGAAGPQHQASLEAAAFTAAALIYLQDAPVDLSYFYTGNAGNMGCFETNGVCRKKAFALKATGAMLDTRRRLSASGGDTMGFAVLAGRSEDKRSVQVLIANYEIQQPQEPPRQSASPGSRGLERRQLRDGKIQAYTLDLTQLPWDNQPFVLARYRLDAQNDFTLVEEIEGSGGRLELSRSLPPPAVELVVARWK